MVVVPTTGNVVVFGTEDGSKAAFYVYESNGEWKKQKTVRSLCGHKSNVKLLAIATEGKDEVLVSCDKCKKNKIA